MAKLEDWVFARATVTNGLGRTSGMAKWKEGLEIEVEVEEVIPKRDVKTGKPLPGQFTYSCIVYDEKGNKIPIGTTFATAIKAKEGEIITVRSARIRGFKDEEGKIYKLSWMWPKVRALRKDMKAPTSWKEIEKAIWIPEKLALKICPHWNNPKICILKSRYERPYLKLGLRYPIKCKWAYRYRCPYVKNYYYYVKIAEEPLIFKTDLKSYKFDFDGERKEEHLISEAFFNSKNLFKRWKDEL